MRLKLLELMGRVEDSGEFSTKCRNGQCFRPSGSFLALLQYVSVIIIMMMMIVVDKRI